MEKRHDPEREGVHRRDDSNTEQPTGQPVSSPFMKDKRPRIRRVTEQFNARTPPSRSEREGEAPSPFRRDPRPEGERRPWGDRPDYRAQEERRPYERREERPREERSADRGVDGSERRRSYNPNFDEDNRLRRPAPRGERHESSEEDRRYNSYRSERDDFPRREVRERAPRYDSGERSAYPPRSDRNDRPGYPPRGDRNERPDYPRGDRPRYTRDDRPQSPDRYPRDERGERPKYGKPKPHNNDRRGGDKRKSDPFRTPKGGYDSEFKPKVYPAYAAANIVEPIRLNKFISMSGLCSRREADELIRQGQVTVNGAVITEMGVKIAPTDTVHCNGEALQGEKRVYILMNKPKGFVTTVEDPNADRTVMDIVKNACRERVYPVGRLDKNSLGVLLITNDGELTKKLTHPSHEKKKVYQVTLDRAAKAEELEKLYDGVTLDDGVAKADEVEFLDEKRREVGITIHTGRNRIVRRMFEELGYHVQKLDRVYFAGLTKKGLRRGAWRYLTPKEVAMIKSGKYE